MYYTWMFDDVKNSLTYCFPNSIIYTLLGNLHVHCTYTLYLMNLLEYAINFEVKQPIVLVD